MSPKGPVPRGSSHHDVWEGPAPHRSPPAQVTPGSVRTLHAGGGGDLKGPSTRTRGGDQGLQATWGPPPLPGPSSAILQSPGDLSSSRERVYAPGRPGFCGKWVSGTTCRRPREPRPLGPVTPEPGTRSALGTQRSVSEWGRAGTPEGQPLRPAALPQGSGSSPACL